MLGGTTRQLTCFFNGQTTLGIMNIKKNIYYSATSAPHLQGRVSLYSFRELSTQDVTDKVDQRVMVFVTEVYYFKNKKFIN